MKLLAIILAFGLFQYVNKPMFLRSFDWLHDLQQSLKKWIENQYALIVTVVILPLLILSILMTHLFNFADNSIGYLLVHVAVLYYCLGPATIFEMIQKGQTKQHLGINEEEAPAEVVYKLTDAALHRWFAIFFWYVVFNVYGALAYRLLCHISQSEKSEVIKVKLQSVMKVIEFPVTIVMTLSLALASDFDQIWKHCKQYLTTETITGLNSQYMYKSMDFAVEQCEIEENDENKSQIIELTTYKVLKRMLVVWLVFSALMVIFSIG
ncbi:hypothetical protein [Marinicella litoralis]|uniref:Membrane protein required for beta-lactamase induction n=1 Tax=Marinicella litoralis TaxID=644220 RepID=A0A4R6XL74_9GAMM|nr:hypothetical protein [Marinicella litoralis]TDR18307.1 membrane protein required for beta-lactamase induction [Marinicella litoralis]